MADTFIAAHEAAPEEIVLDLDATDDPIHGNQEGRSFHGYYGSRRTTTSVKTETKAAAPGEAATVPTSAGSVGTGAPLPRRSWGKHFLAPLFFPAHLAYPFTHTVQIFLTVYPVQFVQTVNTI